jgi:hypothetical protein
MTIEEFASLIPAEQLDRSGKVFYSGRDAFARPSPLYLLGLNPGGCPLRSAHDTVGAHTEEVLHNLPSNWSAYRDESWEGKNPGTLGMAPRILHMFRKLRFNPGEVPASNLIFVRSRREAQISRELAQLSDSCWPFHARVMELLQPKVVLCLGKTTGRYVRNKLGAHVRSGEFVEKNDRRWKSEAFNAKYGPTVVVVTHPGIANWCTPATDPTDLVASCLA